MGLKEDDMSSTLIATCSLCGLRYSNRALLELHIREDHVQHNYRLAADRDGSGDSGPPQRRAGGPSRTIALASKPSRRERGVTPMTATRRPHRPGVGWAMTAARRMVRALRYVNDELLLASEAMIRSARAPQPLPRPEASTGTDAQPAPDPTARDQAA